MCSRYIEELEAEDDSRIVPPVFMCIAEGMLGGMGVDERVSVSLVAVTPSTGEVVWDEFEDGFMRSELEVCICYFICFRFTITSNYVSHLRQD